MYGRFLQFLSIKVEDVLCELRFLEQIAIRIIINDLGHSSTTVDRNDPILPSTALSGSFVQSSLKPVAIMTKSKYTVEPKYTKNQLKRNVT